MPTPPQPRKRPLDAWGRPSAAQSSCPAPANDQQLEPNEVAEKIEHPKNRSECRGGPRPCPLVGCVFNNYLEVRRQGCGKAPKIVLAHPDRLPEDVPPGESCSLDVADDGTHTLEEVANILGLTRERIRQIEVSVIRKIIDSCQDEVDCD